MIVDPESSNGATTSDADSDSGSDSESGVDAADAALFDQLRRTGRRGVRNQIVEAHMGLAVHIARRYNARAGRDDDIEQVAMLALVKAVDRFDATRGVPFSSFAGRTIEGEIKRHFRDATWAVKVPRSAKELHLAVRRANDELAAAHGRSPSVDEVAEHLQIDRDDVITGLAAAGARSTGSLDTSTDDGTGVDPDRLAAVAQIDGGFVAEENRMVVDEFLASLPEREREIVELRFYGELSQSEIAERIGVSQMHVSRLLRRSLEQLRDVDDE